MHIELILLGAANLVPWMTFLALADYFASVYGSNIMEFYFPMVSTTALMIMSAVMLAFGQRYSFDVRIGWPTFAMSLILLVVPALDLPISTGLITPTLGLYMTLGSVCLNAVCSACAQNSLYACALCLIRLECSVTCRFPASLSHADAVLLPERLQWAACLARRPRRPYRRGMVASALSLLACGWRPSSACRLARQCGLSACVAL